MGSWQGRVAITVDCRRPVNAACAAVEARGPQGMSLPRWAILEGLGGRPCATAPTLADLVRAMEVLDRPAPPPPERMTPEFMWAVWKWQGDVLRRSFISQPPALEFLVHR